MEALSKTAPDYLVYGIFNKLLSKEQCMHCDLGINWRQMLSVLMTMMMVVVLTSGTPGRLSGIGVTADMGEEYLSFGFDRIF